MTGPASLPALPTRSSQTSAATAGPEAAPSAFGPAFLCNGDLADLPDFERSRQARFGDTIQTGDAEP